MPQPQLFSPLSLRGVTVRNRVVISPMCTYSARDGIAGDWHFAHLARFAIGGAGMVFTEAIAIEARGRITHGDLGLWNDEQIAPLRRITDFLKTQGAVPAIQLGHAGRKACSQRPWHGNGPLNDTDRARGEDTWSVVAASALPLGEGWLVPHELTLDEIAQVKESWRAAARRALRAGFEVVEIHAAHGYLLHSFLSPLANQRSDRYGGSREARMQLALEVAEIVRSEWPQDRPVFFRVSSVDGVEGGCTIEDTVALAHQLKRRGIDVIDCSSGGIRGAATAASVRFAPGFQVPYAERIKREAGIRTMAVGLIFEPAQAERILAAGQADLIAIGRQALLDPNWTLHAQLAIGEAGFSSWPAQYGWWLERRQRTLSEEDARRVLQTAGPA